MRYSFGDFILDTCSFDLQKDGHSTRVRPKVFDLLTYLITHRDRVIPKHELIKNLWPKLFVTEVTLTCCILELRRALGDDAKQQRVIRTLRGRGHRFVAPVRKLADTNKGESRARKEAAVLSPLRSLADRPSLIERKQPAHARRVEASIVAAPPHPRPLADAVAPLPGEYKDVTILQCSLDQSTLITEGLEPEARHNLMQVFFALVVKTMNRFGGTIQRMFDHEVLVIFGSPFAAEDHADRAVKAAAELAACLAKRIRVLQLTTDRRLTISCGLHTGSIVAASLGDEQHLTVTPVGDTFACAIRLQSAAPSGGVMLSAATKQRLRLDVEVEAFALDQALGEPFIVPAYRLLSVGPQKRAKRSSPASSAPRFVGREGDLAILESHLAEALNGHGQIVGLMGAAGIGKTRLLQELHLRDAVKKVSYHQCRCVSYGATFSFLPIRELLNNIIGLAPVDSAELAESKITHWLSRLPPPSDSEKKALINFLVGSSTGDEAIFGPPGQDEATSRLIQQLLLEYSQTRPLIIELEDVHWADPQTEAWLSSFAQYVAHTRILLLVSYRPGYRPQWLDRSFASQRALPPLSTADSTLIIEDVAAPKRLLKRQTAAILSRADGLPFLLVELTRSMLHSNKTAEDKIPAAIEAVMMTHIDRLPLGSKRLLQVAAVLGDSFTPNLLQHTAECSRATCEQGLNQLVATETIQVQHFGPEPVYTFRYRLFRQVVVQSLLTKTKKKFEQRALRARALRCGKESCSVGE